MKKFNFNHLGGGKILLVTFLFFINILVDNFPQVIYANVINTNYNYSIDIKESNIIGDKTMYTIPVVWHVFTPLADPNTYPEELIHDAIATLNTNFNNKDVTEVIFNFVLAKIDPEGKCTSGITYHDSPLVGSLSPVYDLPLKSAVHWDNSKYLNIYQVTQIVNYLGQPTTENGYTSQPCVPRIGQTSFGGFDCSLAGSTPQFDERDGIVIDDDFLIGLTHEAGHWLGLFHTWGPDGYNPTDYPWWTQCGGPCEENGDFICDTNPMQSFGGQGTCDENTCEPNDNLQDPNDNFMSYSDQCWKSFTLDQYTKMMEVLDILRPDIHSEVNLEATGVINFVSNFNCTGSGILCYKHIFDLPNNGKVRSGSIFVSNGAHLFIDEGVEIKMCKGSFIYIDKGAKLTLQGKITGDYPGIWDGIIVEGTLTSTLNQAKFIGQQGAVVENAVIGVKVLNTHNHKFGQIELDGVTFNNNFTAVKMVSGNDYDFETEIKNCQFTNNVSGIQSFLELERALDVYIIDCDFTNNYVGSTIGQNGIGIYAKSSRFNVFDDLTDLDYSIGCNFYGLDYGIRIESLNSSKYNYIYNNKFEKCQYGIYNLSSTAGRFVYNKFKLEEAPISTTNRYGIYIDGFNTNASIQENTFYGSANSSSLSIGVFHDNTGQSNKFVRRNVFANLKYGVQAINVNANNFQGPQAPGLLYTCNNYNNNEKDIYPSMAEINVININQKGLDNVIINGQPEIISVATGNKFFGSTFVGYNSIHNNMQNSGLPFILNYRRREIPVEIPFNPLQVSETPDPNQNCVKEEFTYLQDPPEDGGGGGEYLMLPEEEEGLKIELLRVNEILTYLKSEYANLSETWSEEIKNSKSNDISNYSIYKDEVNRKFINKLLNAEEINFSEIEEALTIGDDYSMYVWLFREYVDRMEWSKADNTIMLIEEKFSNDFPDEISSLVSVYGILKYKPLLDQNDVLSLQEIADSYYKNGAKWAQTILSQYGYLYHPKVDEESEERNRKTEVEFKKSTENHSVVPNPATNIVTINIPKGSKDVLVEISNAKGLKVLTKLLSENTSVDISNWANGIYIVSFNDNNSVVQKKFIKVN